MPPGADRCGLVPAQIDEVVLVGGSTRIPLVRRRVAELFGRQPHTELNPDEVVALGAAVQADILITGNRDMLLLDVTPLSLGIETMGGVTSKIILRNSTIPATGARCSPPAVDNQTAVDIHVVQGERELVADNRSLAVSSCAGRRRCPPACRASRSSSRSTPTASSTSDATELRTGIEQAIEVKPSYGLTDEEVERMLLDSFGRRGSRLRRATAHRGVGTKPNPSWPRPRRRSALPSSRRSQGPNWATGELKRITSVLAGLKDGARLDQSRDNSEMDARAQ